MKTPHELTRPGRITLTLAIAPALAAVGLAGLSPAAQAATAPSAADSSSSSLLHVIGAQRETFTVPAGQGSYTIAVGGVKATLLKSDTANTCTLGSQTLLSDATVQGVAYISCSVEEYAIAVEAVLYYGSTEESENAAAEYSTFFVQVMTTAPLEAGTWTTDAYSDVYPTNASSYTFLGPYSSSSYWDY